jgi:hypothetical protein
MLKRHGGGTGICKRILRRKSVLGICRNGNGSGRSNTRLTSQNLCTCTSARRISGEYRVPEFWVDWSTIPHVKKHQNNHFNGNTIYTLEPIFNK